VSRYTRAWFGQWLNYLVSSAFLTVVAVIVLKLLSTIFASSFEKFGEGKSAATALGIAMIAAGMTKLFESIPSITDAIFPGRTGAAGAINSNAIAQAANPINSGRNAVAGGKFAASKVKAGYQGGKAMASKVNSWFSKPPTPPASP
jgi:type IV secretory pathway VirB6-like protein